MQNVSLGRGTTTPFALMGAPFVDANKLLERIEQLQKIPEYTPYFSGVKLITAYFQPTYSIHKDKLCAGVRIVVLDKKQVKSIPLALTMIKAINDLYPKQIVTSRSYFTRLVGTEKVQTMIEEGKHIPEVMAAWEHDLENFKQNRKKYLLY